MRKLMEALGVVILILLLGLAILFGYWYLRPNRAQVNTSVVVESWDVINDKMHNSNTDMIQWNGEFYLAYVSSPFHFGSSQSVMHIDRSGDLGRTWFEVTTFTAGDGEDIRDPKLAVIGKRLFLYALKNTSFVAEPYLTVYSYTEDGLTWTDFRPVIEKILTHLGLDPQPPPRGRAREVVQG